MDSKKLRKQKSVTKTILKRSLPELPAKISELGATICTKETKVQFEIRLGSGLQSCDWWIFLQGGPNGHESCNLLKLLERSESDAVWIANAGSDRFERLEVRIEDIRNAVANYSVNYRFEVL